MSHKWEVVGPQGETATQDLSGSFRLTAPPGCDIWRPSPEKNVFDAPAIVTKIKASSFKSMTATVSADWKTLYDQAGILLVFPGGKINDPKDAKSWIKAGVENYQGEPKLGVVGVYAFSDWSLSPCLTNSNTATIQFERSESTVWVYAISDGTRVALREITWAFLEDRAGDAEIWIGVYAAKPTPDVADAKAELEVKFSNVKLETI